MQEPLFGKIVKLNAKAWGVFIKQPPASKDGLTKETNEILVPFALPDEELNITTSQQRQTQTVAKAWQLKKASPDRTTPLCPAFGSCAGCSLQHLSYHQQVAWKKTTAQQAFDQLRNKQPRLFKGAQTIELNPAPQSFYYRNRLSLHLFLIDGEEKSDSKQESNAEESKTEDRKDGSQAYNDTKTRHSINGDKLDGTLALGYRSDEPPFEAVPIQSCFLAPPALFQAAEKLLAFLNAKHQANFFRSPQRISLRQVRTEKIYIELELGLESFSLWASTGWLEEFQALEPSLALKLKTYSKKDFPTRHFPKTAGKKLLAQKTSSGTLLSLQTTRWEQETESFFVGDQLIPLTHENFVQANEAGFQLIFQKLLKVVGSLASAKTDQTTARFPAIVEFYAGPSAFSFLLRNFASRYLNLDWTAPLTKNPSPSAYSQDWSAFTQQRQYLVADLHKKLPKNLAEVPAGSLCIVNPPRNGLSSTVKRYLNQQRFHHLVYVSCNIQSLAFDLQDLAANYQIEQAEAYDLFPQTLHFETFVYLTAQLKNQP